MATITILLYSRALDRWLAVEKTRLRRTAKLPAS
jgi:hypothetical protein